MKVYESAQTYLPLAYLVVFTLTFTYLFHGFENYGSYAILCGSIVNIFLLFQHTSFCSIALHEQMWKAAIMISFGILLNGIHQELFINFHFVNEYATFFYSCLYIAVVWYIAYARDNDGNANTASHMRTTIYLLIVTHILFGFIPLQRIWQWNVHFYVFYCVVCLVMIFQHIPLPQKPIQDLEKQDKNNKVAEEKVTESERGNDDLNPNAKLYRLPVCLLFMYLRIHETLLWVGFLQLYFEYRQLNLREFRAAHMFHSYLDKHHQQAMKELNC